MGCLDPLDTGGVARARGLHRERAAHLQPPLLDEAVDFDQRTLEALTNGEWGHLADYDERTLQRILPEAGLRHLEVLRGFLGADVKGQVLCYEASPGAGAALVSFDLVAGSPGTPILTDTPVDVDPVTGEPENSEVPSGFEDDEETGTA